VAERQEQEEILISRKGAGQSGALKSNVAALGSCAVAFTRFASEPAVGQHSAPLPQRDDATRPALHRLAERGARDGVVVDQRD
jgi:hypothetical protein